MLSYYPLFISFYYSPYICVSLLLYLCFASSARFYYSERKELSAVCVLEDFSQYGWRSARQLYNLPLQHILMAGKIKTEKKILSNLLLYHIHIIIKYFSYLWLNPFHEHTNSKRNCNISR